MLTSGIAALDTLLGGGLESGSSALVMGPAGGGKSLLVLQFIATAIARGESAALFVFDEELGLLFARAKSLGFDLEAMRESGKLFIQQMDAAEVSPGEFAHSVRACVDVGAIRTVAIDSLNGYQNAMPQEQFLILHMHELLQYLNRVGATTFLTVAQHGLVGDMRAPVDVTYLADTVLLLRYFEASGRVRRAISVVKKRTGPHEDTIREFRIGRGGITIGQPLENFQGILQRPADLRRRSANGQKALTERRVDPERALVLAPLGRDAVIAVGMLREAGIPSDVCVEPADAGRRARTRRRRRGRDRGGHPYGRPQAARRVDRFATAVVGPAVRAAHGAGRRPRAQSLGRAS